jgi:CheY-like chemotaxis protein
MTTLKKRVLIVDDEPSFTRLLKLNFNHTGRYAAEVVNDPAQAVQAAEHFLPDVILLDVMMPGMDGGDVANRIHAIPKFRDIPILFLTAAISRKEIADHAGLCGGMRFMAKPIEFQDVLQHVEEECNARKPEALI